MKKSFVYLLILSILLTLIEATLLSGVSIGSVFVKLSLITVIVTAWLMPLKEGLLHALIVGAFGDVLFSRYYLFYVILYIIAAFVSNLISEKVNAKKVYICLFSTFVITVITEFIGYFSKAMTVGFKYSSFALSKVILPQAILNTIVCFAVFYVYRSICKDN